MILSKRCFGLLVLAISGLSTQSALSACPNLANVAYDPTLKRINDNQDVNGQTIYFCKQSFPDASLMFAPSASTLVSGGSQSIAQGNTAQSPLLTNSINLMGFMPSELGLSDLQQQFPSQNGQYGTASLYNFYTRRMIRSSTSNRRRQRICDRESENIKQYLANNAVFQASGFGVQLSSDDTTGNNIAIIDNALMVNDNNQTIEADIRFFHANANKTGQFFTRPHIWRPFRRFLYCWVGVGARLSIDSETANLQQAGDYTVDIGVVTR